MRTQIARITFTLMLCSLTIYAARASASVEFQEYQSMATIGAAAWEYFSIDGQHFLAVANHYSGGNFNVDRLYDLPMAGQCVCRTSIPAYSRGT